MVGKIGDDKDRKDAIKSLGQDLDTCQRFIDKTRKALEAQKAKEK